MKNQISRVLAHQDAKELIDRLRNEHGELMFHQSGGCCDGSQPMCFPKGEFKVGSNDVWVGEVHGCDYFMSADQFEYWKYTQITLTVSQGRGSSFSLEIPLGVRFIIQSHLFTEEEMLHTIPTQNGETYLLQNI
jgi:uncharacterized protein (DUF779 family)